MVNRYLERIGFEGKVSVDLATLQKIQRKQLEMVPYENLDLLHRIPLSFETERLFDKLVTRRRGGVCYEQNFLMGDMLRRMGFTLDFLSGIVAGGAGGDFAHALLLVHLPEGDYIADAGFARGYLTPLRLSAAWQNDGRFRYRLIPEGEWYRLEREDWEIGPVEEYRFTLTPRRREEYREMCDFLCTSPKCKFTYMLVCSREVARGRLTLRDEFLMMEPIGESAYTEPVKSREETNRILWEKFGLNEER